MTDQFHAETYKMGLEASTSCQNCEKVPMPQIGGNQNYIFISYAHRDYKQVYADLADLYEAGVRFWYDEGLPAGEDWDAVVRSRLEDPRCVGVIFYMSPNLFLSGSANSEMDMLRRFDKDATDGRLRYFSVNLTDHSPVAILAHCLQDPENPPLTMAQIHILSGMFTDKSTYVNYHHRRHREDLLEQIRGQFPGVIHAGITLNKLLLQENPCFGGIQSGSYGVGFDKCLVSNGAAGWAPEDVLLEYVEHGEFSFEAIDRLDLAEAYKAFCNTAEIRKIETRGNNRTRWMLSEIYQNERLFLSLQKTRWSATTFWWNQIRDNREKQAQLARHTFIDGAPFFPSSFCLHLIIESADDYLVCARISVNKKNDYATTIAVTIGEQIDEEDFSSDEAKQKPLVCVWCERAMLEEFGFTPGEYQQYVDTTSIRVLGINYEGDIYNFSLPVYMKLNLKFADLLSYMAGNPVSNQEFTELIPMTKEDVVAVLEQTGDPAVSRQYHPSSFLRMLQYLNYRYPDILAT